MTDAFTQEDEALLQRILLGEVDPGSDEARALFARAPESLTRLRELAKVRSTLEFLGERTRELLPDDGARSRRATDRLRSAILADTDREEPAGRGAPPRRRWLRVAVAAALVLAVLPFVLDRGEDPDGLLGPDGDDLRPRGEVEAFSSFEWSAARPPGGRFLVRIPSAGVESPLLRAPPWTPDQELRGRLEQQGEISWELWRLDANGDETLVGAQRARLSPR